MINSLRFSILAFILTGCAATHVEPLPPAAERDSLKFLTVNVCSGLDYKGYLRMGEYETAACRRTRRDILVQQIREIDPDVITLKEANIYD